MEIVLNDTKSPKVRIEILMTGTEIAACHRKWQIVMIWQFVQNGYQTLKNTNVCVILVWLSESFWIDLRKVVHNIMFVQSSTWI